MNRMMKAAVVKRLGAPLEITEVPIPAPKQGQVLIKVQACGVCHTDLHAAAGDWPDKPTLPFIPGHEVAGEVVSVGDEVVGFEPGDRVGVPWLHKSCGRCEACLTGWEPLCKYQLKTGYDVNGGFAEYTLGEAQYTTHIPDGLDYVKAAPLICAGLTVYKGLSVLDARAGEWVVISGIGGLGHLAIQYAKAMGFRVVGVDIDDAKLDLAASLGAHMTVNPKITDPVGYLQRTIGGAHAALVTAVSPIAFSQSVGMLRPGGTVAFNGLPPGDFPLNIYDVVMRAITLRGSIVGSRFDLIRALKCAAQNNITATTHVVQLDEINEVFEKLQHWSVPGRIVIDFQIS